MIQEFIKELERKEINISFGNGKLKYSGPEEYIDSNMLSRLKTNKQKLLKHFWPKQCENMMPINTEGELPPLCMVHAGASHYSISEAMGEKRPYYGFLNFGSDGEKKRFKETTSFAKMYLDQLQFIIPNDNFYLGGFSYGGHLAYEMAILMQDQGYNVPLIIMGDSGIAPKSVFWKKLSFKKKFIFLLKKFIFFFYELFMRFIIVFFGSFYSKIPLSIRKRYILYTYLILVNKYYPQKKFKGKILILRASGNKHPQKYLGWENFCDNIDIHIYEGGHDDMYENPTMIEDLTGVIKEYIDNFEKIK